MNLMGVDLGIRQVALAIFVEDVLVHTCVHEAPIDLSRDLQLADLGSYTQTIGTTMAVDSVWVEDTLIGNNAKYSMALAETKGAVLAALARDRLTYGTDIRTVNVGTWKKAVIGRGNAGKEDVQNYIRVTHPAYAPLCGDDQDLYDAACVGLYGRQVLARATDLTL